MEGVKPPQVETSWHTRESQWLSQPAGLKNLNGLRLGLGTLPGCHMYMYMHREYFGLSSFQLRCFSSRDSNWKSKSWVHGPLNGIWRRCVLAHIFAV